jgi:hypothetical protein
MIPIDMTEIRMTIIKMTPKVFNLTKILRSRLAVTVIRRANMMKQV